MKFIPTAISDVVLIELEPHRDDRGEFARTFCRDTFAEAGLEYNLVQCSISRNPRPFTLRGMHWQALPSREAKVVRCTRGGLFDAALDMRAGSPTFGQWFGVDLMAGDNRMLYIGPGIAHGFLTLEPNTEVDYRMTDTHNPAAARGVRWNDPAFCIRWPAAPRVISERDAGYEDFRPCVFS